MRLKPTDFEVVFERNEVRVLAWLLSDAIKDDRKPPRGSGVGRVEVTLREMLDSIPLEFHPQR